MGALAQLQVQRKTFSVGSPLDRWINTELSRVIDAPVPSAAAAKNARQSLNTFQTNPTGGTFTLAISIRAADGTYESFTTAGIAYNATAATIESAIDTAASGVVSGWTNGDISASAGPLTSTPVPLDFDGASVAGRETVEIVLDGAGLTGGSLRPDPVVFTTPGQTERAALAVLLNYNVISGSVPLQSAATDATGFTKGTPYRVPGTIVQALMREAAAEDANNATYHSLYQALVGDDNDRPKLVETRVAADE